MNRLLVFFLILLSLYGCFSSTNNREIVYDGAYAKGNISRDTVFNGRIKFYSLEDRKLTSEADYKDGLLYGASIVYYRNGKIQSEVAYKDDEQCGYALFYDEAGNLEARQYYYYGLRVGHGIQYDSGRLSSYVFKSLEGDELFYLDYDSIGNNQIDALQEAFFFYQTQDYITHSYHKKEEITEGSLYLIRPPKYDFTYSLCLVDKNFTVRETIETFTGENSASFNIEPEKEKNGLFFALRLDIIDSINKKNMTKFKRVFSEE